MTNTIPLEQILRRADETRRDGYGRYLVVPPVGGKPVGYTRVTTVAGTLDSGGGLAPWKATMAACGMIMRRGLRAQWEALLALYNSDPWYADPSGKEEAKRLVEECAAVGGANDRKEMGTSLHTITALVDLGRAPRHLTEETEADIEAYVKGLAAAGITIVPGMIEVTVVIDDYQAAGTFDRLVIVPGFDLPLVADLKTGAELSYSWQSIAVQMTGYSRGNNIYVQGRATDGSEDKRLPMPAVDQDWGLVIWLNAGQATLELHLVDLNAGWEAWERSMWTRGWRNRKVAQPLTAAKPPSAEPVPDDLVPMLEASLQQVQERKAAEALQSQANAAETVAPAAAEREPDIGYTQRLRDWLQARITAVAADGNAARETLRSLWPADLPFLHTFDGHTPEQLALIEQLLDEVDKRHFIGVDRERPTTDTVGQLLHLFPNTTVTTEDNAS